MTSPNNIAESRDARQRTAIRYRAIIVGILVPTACLLWFTAYRVIDTISQQDEWFADTQWHTRVLYSATAVLAMTGAAVIRYFRLLAGRPISGIVIGIIAATLIVPSTDAGATKRREMVSTNRFYGFPDTTKQYIAFAVPVIVGCVVASERK